ncbi:hypothetical protein FA13DRAFT_282991 [Coprinellus micaceus]|uniref:Uncharacterized protein n=1 Tax=Coprinellus micaceus TaxID=71717 RepID=A0A4Y7TDF8_COPMI|nr:hypothetical protein FA13DRAFT_282991 [Coprinellus micaceus]
MASESPGTAFQISMMVGEESYDAPLKYVPNPHADEFLSYTQSPARRRNSNVPGHRIHPELETCGYVGCDGVVGLRSVGGVEGSECMREGGEDGGGRETNDASSSLIATKKRVHRRNYASVTRHCFGEVKAVVEWGICVEKRTRLVKIMIYRNGGVEEARIERCTTGEIAVLGEGGSVR